MQLPVLVIIIKILLLLQHIRNQQPKLIHNVSVLNLKDSEKNKFQPLLDQGITKLMFK